MYPDASRLLWLLTTCAVLALLSAQAAVILHRKGGNIATIAKSFLTAVALAFGTATVAALLVTIYLLAE